MIRNIPKILEDLSKNSSILKKKKILEETKCDALKYIFKQAYDPFINFGTVKIDISDLKYDEKRIVNEGWWLELTYLLKKLETRHITGNLAREIIKGFLDKSPKKWADLVLKILKKDLRIGAGSKIINSVYPNLFPEDLCMAAMKYDKDRIKFPVYADTKLDGVRCIVDMTEKKIFSRNGKEFKNYPSIMKELEQLNLNNEFKIDGEIVMGHFQDLMRTVSRKEEGIELAKDAVYNIFDIIIENKTFQERLLILDKIKEEIKENDLKHLKVIKGKKIENEKELLEFYEEQLENGFEGIMIKNLDGQYEYKRSYNWMKMKPEDSEDLPIIRVEEGTGKYKNLLGAVVCVLPNKTKVNVGSGFNDEERIEYWNKRTELIGQIIEVKYQEKTKDGSLRFPVFVRFRKDK